MSITIQDVPVAPSEHTEADVAAPTADVQSRASLRIVAYVVAVLALFVIVWSLIEGGDRDLWTSPASVQWLQTIVAAP